MPFGNLQALRDYANGRINEDTMKGQLMDPNDGYDFENDEAFIQECMDACFPTIMQMALMENVGDALDEATTEAVQELTDYMINNGYMTEAATVSLTNPKINIVRLNKQAQINRLKTIISLKMARRDKIKPYQKYKFYAKGKKENLRIIMGRYGQKAERLARKLVMKRRKGKAAAVVEKKKEDVKAAANKK